MNIAWLKPFFIVSGCYDAVLGIAFLVASGSIFEAFSVTPPNHMAYVKFPALLLLVFAGMFFRIASDPVKHRDLIVYGIGLKLSYTGTVLWYQATEGVPSMWIPWAWADLAFLLLFALAYRVTAPQQRSV